MPYPFVMGHHYVRGHLGLSDCGETTVHHSDPAEEGALQGDAMARHIQSRDQIFRPRNRGRFRQWA